MRLRNHHIRKVRTGWRHHGWLVQPLTATDGEKLTLIVPTFAEAADIALPKKPRYLTFDGVVYLGTRNWTSPETRGIVMLAPPPGPPLVIADIPALAVTP